jgi:hypothetical protein
MKTTLLALLVVASSLLQATAQKMHTISGRITDTTAHSLDFVTVILHTLPDSTVAKGGYTDSAGNYVIEQCKAGTYYLEVSSAGYIAFNTSAFIISADTMLPVVMLRNSSKQLGDVSITGRRSMIVRKQDRTIVNVDAMLTAAGSSTLDMLEKCPGLQVSQDGNITLKGKQGVNVFINDKPTYMSAEELANYLRSLPSSSVDQVEIMTNPPAGYDAAGGAGIVNIKLKRKGAKGLNGGVNIAYTQGVLARGNGSINLNYRNNKVSAFLSGGYNLFNGFTDLTLNRTYKDGSNNPQSYFEQKSYFKRHNDGYTLNTGVDYSVTDKTTVGVAFTGMANASWTDNANTSWLLNEAHSLDSVIASQNNNQSHFSNGGINLNYRRQFRKEGHNLSADADYIVYNTHGTQQFDNRYYTSSRAFVSSDRMTGDLPNTIKIYSLKADYNVPVTRLLKLSSGVKTSYTTTDNQADYTKTLSGISSPDYDKSNRFMYKETINAAYASMAWEATHFSAQAGLRVENTISDGHQLGNPVKPDSAFLRNYTNAFPTVYLSWKVDTLSNHVLNFNVGRRINRPYYEDLNPFVNPMDKFTYYVGNPFLKPSLSNTFELSYVYKNKIAFGLNYTKTHDDINETIEISNGIYYSRSGNIGSKSIFTASVDADFDPAKWLNAHVYSEVGNIKSTSAFYNGTLNTQGTYWFISGVARINAGKGWDAELNGNYRSTITDAQFVIKPLWIVNTAVRKKVGKSVILKLNMSDLLYAQKVRGQIGSLTGADASWINRRDSRCITFMFTYNFGTSTGNTQRTTSGAEDEKNRVKS